MSPTELLNATPPVRILFVFDWLVIGGEETEVRLLARHLDRRRYALSVLACFRNERMTELTREALQRLGIHLDTTCYDLDDDGRARYLAQLIRRQRYAIVVACQGVQHPHRAMELLPPAERPLLVEHGGLVSEVFRTPKHFTTAYVGVCREIVQAAAGVMPDPRQARLIPSMVDLSEFEGHDREAIRRELGFAPRHRVAGWVGRLDRKKRVEDFVEAAALLHPRLPEARFLVIGGADAFMPEYETELHDLARRRGLEEVMVFTGDRADVPRLLAAMDAFAWLSEGEGMPHVVLEAGASRLPVVATPDGGAASLIVDGHSGLFVPHRSPAAVAHALERLLTQPDLATSLGVQLRRTVERQYGTDVVCRAWEALFAELIAMSRREPRGSGGRAAA
ncbi:MAG TPA: glycosyltransferase family 4 protein [Chloroflexota bacterium]|nr:glycosyltransferase family 4 protein [Chloroflexota bacterium]